MQSMLKATYTGLMVASCLVAGTTVFAEEAAKAAPEPVAKEQAAPDETKKVTDLIAEKGYACVACHQVETKTVGPAYKEIAVKYQDAADKEEVVKTLSAKIKEGGKGTWGEMPMPPNPTVTDEDLSTIVHWVLSLAGTEAAKAQ